MSRIIPKASTGGSVGPPGPAGANGADGATGPQGVQGFDGTSIIWIGTYASPPSSPGFDNAYYDSTLKKSYVWDGSTWNQICQDGSGAGMTNTFYVDPDGTPITDLLFNKLQDAIDYIDTNTLDNSTIYCRGALPENITIPVTLGTRSISIIDANIIGDASTTNVPVLTVNADGTYIFYNSAIQDLNNRTGTVNLVEYNPTNVGTLAFSNSSLTNWVPNNGLVVTGNPSIYAIVSLVSSLISDANWTGTKTGLSNSSATIYVSCSNATFSGYSTGVNTVSLFIGSAEFQLCTTTVVAGLVYSNTYYGVGFVGSGNITSSGGYIRAGSGGNYSQINYNSDTIFAGTNRPTSYIYPMLYQTYSQDWGVTPGHDVDIISVYDSSSTAVENDVIKATINVEDDYDYISWKFYLPDNFDGFVASNALSIWTYTTDDANTVLTITLNVNGSEDSTIANYDINPSSGTTWTHKEVSPGGSYSSTNANQVCYVTIKFGGHAGNILQVRDLYLAYLRKN